MLSDFTLAIITLIAIISEYKTFSHDFEASYILELCFLGLSLAFSMYCVITNIQAAVAVPGSFSFYNAALSLRRVSPAVTSVVCNACLSGYCAYNLPIQRFGVVGGACRGACCTAVSCSALPQSHVGADA